MRIPWVWAVFLVIIGWVSGCNSATTPAVDPPVACSAQSTTRLSTYDQYSAQFLDQTTTQPATNLGGQVVWNTRYYLESLITAYQATKNPKYLAAFEETGTTVMNLVQTLEVPGGPDPSAPGKNDTGPTIQIIGWPTYMATFGEPISVLTSDGSVSFYAQSFYPRNSNSSDPIIGASFIDITQQADGSLQFAWSRAGASLQTYPLVSVNDLSTIASQPLVYGQSLGRINPTGAGLPAPGSYELDTPLITVWHEQTGGILLPFVRFLLIAKRSPGLVDPKLVAEWQTQVLQITSSYVDQFVSDGDGGFTFCNPTWMPITDAGMNSNSDYVFVEVSLRMLLFELTGDSTQLVYARGLLQHQLVKDIPIDSNGWLMVREWPDIQPWSSQSQAPPGVIWDSFSYDPTTPEDSTEGAAFAEMIDLANAYDLTGTLGISNTVFRGQFITFAQFLSIPNAQALGLSSSVRSTYPWSKNDRLSATGPSSDPFAAAGYLWPESSDSAYWLVNWQWMSQNGTSPQGQPVGYFLRAWARSEAALLSSCKSPSSGQ